MGGVALDTTSASTETVSDSPDGSATYEKYTAVYDSTVSYLTGSPTSDGEQASQVFSFTSPSRWTTISRQDGEVICEARVDALTWQVSSDDCSTGVLLSATPVSGGASGLLMHFPIHIPGFVDESWAKPSRAVAVPIASVSDRIGSPFEQADDATVTAYRLVDADGGILEWSIVEGHPVPSWLRQTGGGTMVELSLVELEDAPRHVVDDVPDFVREAVGVQEELLRTSPEYQTTEEESGSGGR